MTRLLAALLAVAVLSAPSLAKGGDPYEFLWSPDQIRVASLGGHSDDVAGFAFSADGKTFASASADGSVLVWRRGEDAPIRRLRADAPLQSVALSRDGATVLAGGRDGMIRLWSLKTGAELLRAAVADGRTRITAVAFLDDGRSAAALSYYYLSVVDLATGKSRRLELGDDPYSQCTGLSADGRWAGALYGNRERRAVVFDVAEGRVAATMKSGKGDYQCGIVPFPDGKRALVHHSRGFAEVWDVPSGKALAKLKIKGPSYDDLREMTLSPDGTRAAAAADTGVWIWDTAVGKALAAGRGLTSGWTPAFAPDGKALMIGSYDGSISELDGVTGDERRKYGAAAVTKIDVSTGAGGGFILGGPGMTQEALDPLNAAQRRCAGSGGFTAFSCILKSLRAAAFEKEPQPSAPVLTQGAYESGAAFQERVAAAKAQYEKALSERQKRIDGWRMPDVALPTAFLDAFGRPAVAGVKYDPDSRVFTFDVAPTLAAAQELSLTLALREEVPNDKAEAFSKMLAAAQPRLTFFVSAGRFSLAAADIVVDGNHYAALPSGPAAAKALAKVDVGAEVGRPAEASAAPDVSFGFAQSPELAAKERELAERRRKQADAEQLAALEKKIRELRRGAQDGIVSDVDEPGPSRPEDPDALAVVVGIEGYQDSELPAARFAERDAQAVAKRLQALGVAPRNMKVLVGADATRAKLAGVLEQWLPARAREGSKVYFYFSGHGAPDAASRDSYLVPWDGDPSLLKQTGFPLRALYADLEKVPAARRVAVLDACFSGAGGRSLLAKGARPLVLERGAGSDKVTVLAAASASQITATLESQGHGLFTYEFLKALGAGGRAASSLYAELKPKVEDEAARQSREQTPAFTGPDAPIP